MPEEHTHYSNLSLALLKFGQPGHAAIAARTCAELNPDFTKGWFRLGQALRATGKPAEAVEALVKALELAQRTCGKEAAEIDRELAVCRAEAATIPLPVAATEPGKAVRASSGAPLSPPKAAKGKVDVNKVQAAAKRAAEIAAPSAGTTIAAAASLSAFERRFEAVWQRGKGGTVASELRGALGALPSGTSALVRFVGEGLTEELLSGLVLSTLAAQEPPAVGAARLCGLCAVRRFDMCWMFVGKLEKAAVEAVLRAAASEVDPAELAAAARSYGVKLV